MSIFDVYNVYIFYQQLHLSLGHFNAGLKT